MRGSQPDSYKDIQQPNILEDICYQEPSTASYRDIWERIRVKQGSSEILVDATSSWLSRDESGRVRYRSTYKIEGNSITTVSHTQTRMKTHTEGEDSGQ